MILEARNWIAFMKGKIRGSIVLPTSCPRGFYLKFHRRGIYYL
jgi:hypothetical protein